MALTHKLQRHWSAQMVLLQEHIYHTCCLLHVQLSSCWSVSHRWQSCCQVSSVDVALQVLVCQLLMDSIKAYNSLLPLVIVLPLQNLVRTGEQAVNVTSSDSRHVQPVCNLACWMLRL